MKPAFDRAVLTVLRHNDLWAVEHAGDHFGHAVDKEVAKAAAHRRARQMQDKGQACQIRVMGELGYFGG